MAAEKTANVTASGGKPGRLHCPECALAVPMAASKTQNPAIYCSNCGQKLVVGKLDLKQMIGELASLCINLELPILTTTRHLMVAPGRVARAWINGKRQTYVNPLKFIVVVGVIVALTHRPLQDLLNSNRDSGGAVYESGLAHYQAQFFGFFCILLGAPLAMMLSIFGRALKVKVAWLEWYVLGLYVFGLGCLLQLLFKSFLVLSSLSSQLKYLVIIEALIPVVLLVFGAYGFVKKPDRWRAVLLTSFGLIVFVLTTGWIYQKTR